MAMVWVQALTSAAMLHPTACAGNCSRIGAACVRACTCNMWAPLATKRGTSTQREHAGGPGRPCDYSNGCMGGDQCCAGLACNTEAAWFQTAMGRVNCATARALRPECNSRALKFGACYPVGAPTAAPVYVGSACSYLVGLSACGGMGHLWLLAAWPCLVACTALL